MKRRFILHLALPIIIIPTLLLPVSALGQGNAETAIVLPWVFDGGSKGAVSTVKEVVTSLLAKAALDVASEGKVVGAWRDMGGSDLDSDKREMPTPKQLLSLGEKLGVRWAIAGRARWHTKSVWITLGPKTKSDCTVDVLIVDVQNKEVALDAKQVRMDSTAKEDALKALGTVVLTPLFTMVSGGPKTPHEQRAGALAVAKAMQPWLNGRISKKIDADKKIP